jgi:pSer/pThr/pTyr-binding forkhead associated (FHA) protein
VVQIGDHPQQAELVVRNLHVHHIHCEVEVEEEQVLVSGTKAPLGEKPLRKELHAGEIIRVGHSELRLEAGAKDVGPLFPEGDIGLADDLKLQPLAAAATETKPDVAKPPPETAAVRKQLMVVDGGDRGRVFFLPETGICTIGKSSKHADIVLHDLYVARVHCELQIQGDRVRVIHVEGQGGTLLDGQPVTEQPMQVGSVLRVGNSQLRLEVAVAPAAQGKKDTEPRLAPLADEIPAEEVVEVEDLEVIDDIVETVASETAEATTTDQGQVYALPHSPIDQLLGLEDKTLGHFKVGPLLGRGQSGLVFRAQDLHTNQIVALKVLSPDFPAQEAELQHFIGALKGVPKLAHPNLVGLLRAGRSGPCCWIAREYVDGEGLARIISRAPAGLDWTVACRILLHLAQALKFLHEHKLTHGNITPRNILLSKNKVTKLADLMLYRALHGSRLRKIILQKKLLAEAVFLAPEQSIPKALIDHRTDQYALGTVAYILLTGQPPFAGRSLQEITTEIREAKVVRPGKKHPGIPASFEKVVLKMMSRSAEDRFSSAEELLACLQPIAEEHGITGSACQSVYQST